MTGKNEGSSPVLCPLSPLRLRAVRNAPTGPFFRGPSWLYTFFPTLTFKRWDAARDGIQSRSGLRSRCACGARTRACTTRRTKRRNRKPSGLFAPAYTSQEQHCDTCASDNVSRAASHRGRALPIMCSRALYADPDVIPRGSGPRAQYMRRERGESRPVGKCYQPHVVRTMAKALSSESGNAKSSANSSSSILP